MLELISLEDLTAIDADAEITDLYHSFMKDISTVYVLENGIFLGIVTRTQLARKEFKPTSIRECINVEHPKLVAQSGTDIKKIRSEAQQLMLKNNKIVQIPVITADGKLAYVFERIVKNKDALYSEAYARYLQLLQAGYSIADYLRYHNIHTIGIYGADDLASLLYNDLELQNYGNIAFIINNGKTRQFEKQNTVRLSSLTEEQIRSVDALIVTPPHFAEEIIIRNKALPFKQSISIYDLLADLHNYAYVDSRIIKKIIELTDRGVKCAVIEYPKIKKIENPSEHEQYLQKNDINSKLIQTEFEKYIPLRAKTLGQRYTEEDIPNLCKRVSSVPRGGYAVSRDFKSKYVNTSNGRRVTVGAPDSYENTVHVFGNSLVFGLYAEDADTIPSHLQKLVNEESENKYMVINYGLNGLSNLQILWWIEETHFDSGDVFVFINLFKKDFEYACKQCGINYIDMNRPFSRPHNFGEVFVDNVHLSGIGNSIIASEIFRGLFAETYEKNEKFTNLYGVTERDVELAKTIEESPLEYNAEFIKYIEELKQYKKNRRKVGSIVMNCNPFTLGHRYLIEKAAGLVDCLFVFIVEEDRSVFPFQDRIELVKAGVKDLDNVIILPSGKFIISTVTFPEYFVKGDETEAIVDTTVDLELFARKIAPALGITVRFVGNEPNCNITRQYNENMRVILPKYGIEFIEFPRLESDDLPISASTVRAMLEMNDLDGIKKIVPPVTFEYLTGKFTGKLTTPEDSAGVSALPR